MIRLTAAALAAVTIALAVGCSTAGQDSTAAGGQRSATAPASSAASVPAPRLTIAQARAAYIRIARPFNAAVAAVNRDVADGAPWSRFRADTLAVVRADRAWARRMRAERWPPRVGRYVAAMLRSDIPAEIRCDRAMAAAGGMQAATTVFNTRPDCKDRTANEDKIRRILHLPPVT